MKTYSNLNELNFLSVLVVSPAIKIGNIEHNTRLIIEEIEKNTVSSELNLIIFPELCLTGATFGDYVLNSGIERALDAAIYSILEATYAYQATIILGTCVYISNKLINCALFMSNGKLLGIVPKNIDNRWFKSWVKGADLSSIIVNGYDVPIFDGLIFRNFCDIGIIFGSESLISFAKMSEVDVIICFDTAKYSFNDNKAEIIGTISRITSGGIVYVGGNSNESSAEGVYFGELFGFECGKRLGNGINSGINDAKSVFNLDLVTEKANKTSNNSNLSSNFSNLITKYYRTDFDIDIIRGERKHKGLKSSVLSSGSSEIFGKSSDRIVKFDFIVKNFTSMVRLSSDKSSIYSDPFNTFGIKVDISVALEILNAQALSLSRRISSINCNKVVIGVSGGVDSALALLVAVRSFEILGLELGNIHAISLPGLATEALSNIISEKLCSSLGVSYSLIDINASVLQHFSDIGHDINKKDIVYENTQARIRTLVLLDIANSEKSIVLGTGDMSEIALGWNTFNGDHISNYNINCGVPKSVAQAILSSIISSEVLPFEAISQLELIINRPISPELLPSDSFGRVQATEDIIGPFELHDFFLYYYVKCFFSSDKLLYIALETFKDRYSVGTIEGTLAIFMRRFAQNQYKRNCSPDGVSIFDISLTQRGGLLFPSDIEVEKM